MLDAGLTFVLVALMTHLAFVALPFNLAHLAFVALLYSLLTFVVEFDVAFGLVPFDWLNLITIRGFRNLLNNIQVVISSISSAKSTTKCT
jgi:uncharacterized membrane protein YjdF